jgi:hypothetical protein
MDVYDLILQKGTLNALKYAQSIERTNYRLASEIDDAVIDVFNKFSQSHIGTYDYAPVATPQPRQQKQQVPNAAISQFVEDLHRQEEKGGGDQLFDDRSFLFKVIHQLVSAGYDFRLVKYAFSSGNYHKLYSSLGKLVLSPNDTKLIQQVAENLANLPKITYGGLGNDLRSNAIKLIKGKLPSETYNQIFHESADILSKESTVAVGGVQNTVRNYLGTNSAPKVWHPALKDSVSEFKKAITSDPSSASFKRQKVDAIMKEAKGMKPNEIIELLKQKGLSRAVGELEGHLGIGSLSSPGSGFGVTANGAAASEKIAEETLTKSESGAGVILKFISTKIPGLSKFLPMFMKFLPWIAAFFEGKGLIEEIQEYGWDGKTICDACAMITTICSMIPPLSPVAIPVSLAVHGICFVGELFGGMKHEEKTSKTHAGKLITLDDIKKAAGEASFNSLDSNDQKIIQNLYSQYKDDESRLSEEVNKAKNSNQFHDALHAVAVVYNALHTDHNAIPALPSPATSPSAPSTTSRSRYIFRPVYAA